MARRKRGDFLTKQPGSLSTHGARRIFIGLAVAVGCVLVALVVAYISLLSWLQGDGFRSKISTYMQKTVHAQEVSIPENLLVDGNMLTLPQFTLRKAKYFDELSVSKLHVGLNRGALLRRILRMDQFSAEELKLVLRPREEQAPESKGKSTNVATPQKHTQKATSVPTAGFFKEIQARSFEAHYADTSLILSNREYGLNGYRLVASPYPEGGKDAWTLAIENGRVVTPFSWLSESGVKSATVRLTGDEIRLTSCRILLSPGDIRAKADYKMSTGLWTAKVDVQRANVERLLKADWRKKLIGALVSHIDFSGRVGEGWKADGELRMEDGMVEGLPILSELKVDGMTPYRKLKIEKASCRLSFPYSDAQHNIHQAWLWDHIDVRAQGGTLVVRGHVITGQDGSLSGTLRIGVPQKLLVQLGLADTPLASQLFNAPIESPGYLWLHMNLSGTLADPHEDLSVRLATVLPQCITTISDKAVRSLRGVLSNFVPADLMPGAPQEQQDKQDAQKSSSPATPKPVDKAKDAIQRGLDLFL